jgi:hypothetical protein
MHEWRAEVPLRFGWFARQHFNSTKPRIEQAANTEMKFNALDWRPA